mmetsp:Transcript_16188/g.34215  ORF Transcript_16188/g.34215 Transcript_16188/m.34215 type:complete len:600 (+) Transcript_16188:64-1863(+)
MDEPPLEEAIKIHESFKRYSQQKMAEEAETPEEPPTILEGVGWKRRSGFGKYSDTIGMGSAWERRRFALTTKPLKLSYYSAGDESSTPPISGDESPRGTLNILPERVTITATYFSDATQPTPYSVTLKTMEGEKWKFCFDDRETQLIWLVALTDIVAETSVQEFNAKVLTAEVDKSSHGGFHRLYEEDDRRMLDLIHNALLSGGFGKKRIEEDNATGDEAIEVVSKSIMSRNTSIRIVSTLDDATESGNPFTPRSPANGITSPKAAFFSADGNENKLPVDKLYQAITVVIFSVILESCAEITSSILWKFVNVIVLCICFFPTKKSTQMATAVSNTKQNKQAADSVSKKAVSIDENNATETTPLMVKTELMKAEGVPLSDMPSFKASKPTSDDEKAQTPPQRLEPLTEDEMNSHSHERWAVSAPSVDLTGEWTLIADDNFKTEYDAYLKSLGFSGITRRVACGLIARTTEATKHSNNGRELYLKGTNPKGAWERTLTSSGYPDFDTQPEKKEGEDYSHVKTSIKTADSEDVDAEAWWEDRGTKHRSWLRGGKKYGGGDFESLRYVEEGSDGKVLVCESFFHPSDPSKKKAVVNWRFQRDE